jgi:lipopolysaccharide transport system ATP-binding protein
LTSLSLDGLGKRYLLGKQKASAEPPPRLNLGIVKVRLPRFAARADGGEGRELWALRDVTFDVDQGVILGIIGANGAGKSTLLKIIARVTRPTEGRVTGRGRVVSLIELGAGFNPDFSARENILMNAAMHGIPRAEVLSQFDDIVQFAEVERFLDSAVRHFSSGMYLRLAFSVAIHMKPSILLADEILAVGDIAFQERCLQRVDEEAKKGLTVLFVSHDMQAVARLCQRVIWLDKGRVVRDGNPSDVVAEYQAASLASGTKFHKGDAEKGRHANVQAEILSVRLLNAEGEVVGAARLTEDAFIRIRMKARKADVALRGIVDVETKGTFLFRSIQEEQIVSEGRSIVDLIVRLPANLLAPTTYTIGVVVQTYHAKETKVVLPNALTFMVYGGEEAGDYKAGLIGPRLDWSSKTYRYVPKGKRQQQAV